MARTASPAKTTLMPTPFEYRGSLAQATSAGSDSFLPGRSVLPNKRFP